MCACSKATVRGPPRHTSRLDHGRNTLVRAGRQCQVEQAIRSGFRQLHDLVVQLLEVGRHVIRALDVRVDGKELIQLLLLICSHLRVVTRTC